MSADAANRIAEYRALRDAAWALVHADVAMLQNDLAERGIGERIKDKVGEEATEVWGQARDVAGENKGIVAATLLALVAWLLRGPLVHGVESLLGTGAKEHPDAENVEDGRGEPS
jgi:hypothetical protein